YDIPSFRENLKVRFSANDGFILQVQNGKLSEFPVRETFAKKLLSWYRVPTKLIYRFEPKTLELMFNDLISQIKSNPVIKIENEEALTIVSERYRPLLNKDLIEMFDIDQTWHIRKNDYVFLLQFKKKFDYEPVKGDKCGFSLTIKNSETGFSAVTIFYHVFRYWCSNGAYHSSKNGAISIYHTDIYKSSISDIVAKILSGAEDDMEQINSMMAKYALYSPALILPSLKSNLKSVLSSSQIEYFTNKAKDVPHETVWDLYNSLTEKAKKLSLNQRVAVETLAGNLFSESSAKILDNVIKKEPHGHRIWI
ncbi:MAG: DUF932 domain-containing protein, partial [Ignavibacteriaceae bacterium]|nr:DUF932 domain-containing protein [Ignavibacteriaceae bacterium]